MYLQLDIHSLQVCQIMLHQCTINEIVMKQWPGPQLWPAM